MMSNDISMVYGPRQKHRSILRTIKLKLTLKAIKKTAKLRLSRFQTVINEFGKGDKLLTIKTSKYNYLTWTTSWYTHTKYCVRLKKQLQSSNVKLLIKAIELQYRLQFWSTIKYILSTYLVVTTGDGTGVVSFDLPKCLSSMMPINSSIREGYQFWIVPLLRP